MDPSYLLCNLCEISHRMLKCFPPNAVRLDLGSEGINRSLIRLILRLTNIIGTTSESKRVKYPDLSSAMRPVPHSGEFPVLKFTLVQALRLCTGRTAHSGSRGIALLFLDHFTRRGEGSESHPGRSLPPEKTLYPLYWRLGGPQGRSGQVKKISPPSEFDHRTVQPVASRYTDWATRPSPVPKPTENLTFSDNNSASDEDHGRQEGENVDCVPTFEASCSSSDPHLLKQGDLNDLVRDLSLSNKLYSQALD